MYHDWGYTSIYRPLSYHLYLVWMSVCLSVYIILCVCVCFVFKQVIKKFIRLMTLDLLNCLKLCYSIAQGPSQAMIYYFVQLVSEGLKIV